tara:strand:- start:984 stop:1595 length:612 start_codon:yes stop_codon:yes gene_type:complete
MNIIFYLIIFLVCLIISFNIVGTKKNLKLCIFFFLPIFFLCSLTYYLKGSKDFFSFEQKLKDDLKSEKELDPEKLILFLESQLKKNPKDLEGWKILARTCLFAGYIQKANLYYDKAINFFPKDLSLIKEYAFFKRENKEIEKAIELAEKIKKIDNKDIENLTFLIELYIELEMKKKAKNEIDLLRNQNVDPNIIDELLKKISS